MLVRSSFLKKRILTPKNRKILWTILLILLCGYVYFGHNYKLIYTHGTSMAPTYQNGEILFTKKIKEKYTPKRFDVVIIHDSVSKDTITKRILGLPGEKLEFFNGRIYIDDEPLSDPYFIQEWYHEKKVYHIPTNCIWVIGDNREESFYGIFLIKEVKGLVW